MQLTHMRPCLRIIIYLNLGTRGVIHVGHPERFLNDGDTKGCENAFKKQLKLTIEIEIGIGICKCE